MRLSELWRWEGTIGRVAFALIGLLAFVLKYCLDFFIARFAFGREWPLTGYWFFPFSAVSLEKTLQENAGFIAALLVLALPFIWLGVVLTIRRLRSIGWPNWPVVFFFLPFFNLLFFLLLCTLPAADGAKPSEDRRRWPEAHLPNSSLGAAAFAASLTVLGSVPSTILGLLTH